MAKRKKSKRKKIENFFKNPFKKIKNKNKFFIFGITGVLLLILFLGASLVIFSSIVKSQLPPLEQFGERKISQSTKIYDRTGEVLLYEIFGDEKRTLVNFEDIPEKLKQATLAAENEGFYTQPAFDIKAIIRAFIANVREGEIVQGGSTITQQLVKNTLLSSEKTITRKVKEIILAIELDSKYSKDEIFSAYLNQIPYGSNAYGVEAASQTFFDKPVSDLSLSQLATLASLPQAPSYYSPWGDNVNFLINRRDRVLDKMFNLEYITEEERNQAKTEDVIQSFAPPSIGSIKAPHFSLMVRDYLIKKYGEEVALNGGLRVITTLDWEIQEIAEDVISKGATRNEELYGGRNASLVAQDPKTGQIMAIVGSRDYFDTEIDGNFNVATQGFRQPGSALKPFVYLEAFNKGFHPRSVVIDAPTEFVSGDPNCPPILTSFSRNNSNCFNPENFDGTFRGPVSLQESLSQSINVSSVKVLYLVGLDDVLKTLNNFGITTLNEKWRYGLSLVLGGGEVRLMELINAYSTLADDGVFHEQSIILEVKDSKGEVLEKYLDNSQRVYNPQPVRLVNRVLSDINLRSGLLQSSLSLTVFPGKQVAMKTGTTNNYKDAWAFGYTPSIAIGIWAGNNNNTAMTARGSSLLAAIPMWSEFLNRVFNIKNFDDNVFRQPTIQELPNKPMLNGEAIIYPEINEKIYPQLRSSLFWIERSDILGPAPSDPSKDSQFLNWEKATEEWGKLNISNFSEFNKKLPQSIDLMNIEIDNDSEITISNISPENGEFVETPFIIRAKIVSLNKIKSVELLLNDESVQKRNISTTSYMFSYKVDKNLLPQNSLEIIVIDKENNIKSVSFVLYEE